MSEHPKGSDAWFRERSGRERRAAPAKPAAPGPAHRAAHKQELCPACKGQGESKSGTPCAKCAGTGLTGDSK